MLAASSRKMYAPDGTDHVVAESYASLAPVSALKTEALLVEAIAEQPNNSNMEQLNAE